MLIENLRPALLLLLSMTALTGVLYPMAVLLIAQWAFPYQANGSLLVQEGRLMGSEHIGQRFTAPQYFHSRPSVAGTGYDATASGGSNLAPTRQELLDRIDATLTEMRSKAPTTPETASPAAVPIDLVTTSGSGLDPHITPAAALYQVPRVAIARAAPYDQVRSLVLQHIEKRQWGVLGEPRVNVLALNRALDQRFPTSPVTPLPPPTAEVSLSSPVVTDWN